MPIEMDKVECLDAYKNPSCPYVTQININTNCMKNVEKTLIALMGEDGTGLNEGVIHEVLDKLSSLMKTRSVNASWVSFWKPVAVSVVITAITTFLITRFG
jgi:hypothetical protein